MPSPRLLHVLEHRALPDLAAGKHGREQQEQQTQANRLLNCHAGEASTWLAFTEEEREALRTHDHVTLFRMGAHPFLTLTLFIAMFERDNTEPLEYQKAYGAALAGFSLPYPDIST